VATGTERDLPPDIEFALLRTAQEALANVAKHAAATRVGLTLSYMDEEVVLDVRDDGRGFDPARSAREPAYAGAAAPVPAAPVQAGPPHGGFGLLAMRQRIEDVAGTLEVESEPGAGTAISASVPAPPVGGRG
jgi:signal transduction histidine kinase